MCIGLYLTALLFAVTAIAIGRYREYLMPMLVLGGLTFVFWSVLNYWVIAGFLNSPGAVIYGIITVVLMGAWLGAISSYAIS